MASVKGVNIGVEEKEIRLSNLGNFIHGKVSFFFLINKDFIS